MKWTYEKPNDPGYYWFRENMSKGYFRQYIIELYFNKYTECLFHVGPNGITGKLDDLKEWFGGQFAGPIPEPT